MNHLSTILVTFIATMVMLAFMLDGMLDDYAMRGMRCVAATYGTPYNLDAVAFCAETIGVEEENAS